MKCGANFLGKQHSQKNYFFSIYKLKLYVNIGEDIIGETREGWSIMSKLNS